MPDEFEPETFFADLAATKSSGRTKLDRYRDFRAVFLGSEAGKRVLHDLTVQGHIYRTSAVLDDSPRPYLRTYFNDGERNLVLWILGTLHREPKDPPAKQQTREEDDVST